MKLVRPAENKNLGDPGLRRKAAILASVIALVAMVVGALFGDRGMLQLVSQRRRAEALHHQLDDLRAENLALAVEIEALKTDPAAIESMAREELGLARPGELVFVLQSDAPPPHP